MTKFFYSVFSTVSSITTTEVLIQRYK